MSAEKSPVDVTTVDRSPLLRRVLGSEARLVRVIAPAGFGKSRFARSIMNSRGGHLTADCSDVVDAATAVRALVRALGPFTRGFQERQSRLVLSLPRDGSADDRWSDVLDEALERSDGSAVLCVDNGEFLVDRPRAAELVDRALRHPGRFAVFCSRVPVQLPLVSRMPPNECYDIAAAELQFTDAEIERLFAPFNAGEALVARVRDLSRGWPIAVLTFLRAAREHRLSEALGGITAGLGIAGIGEYTLSQGLGSLSDAAREILAAASILGSVSDEDLAAMTADVEGISREFDLCPFVNRTAGARDVHPLAVAALAPMRDVGRRVLLHAAAVLPPIRAAQFYVAAGEPDRAADVLDTSVAPFMMEQPTSEVAAVVASLDEGVLLRHPATWNATWMNRGYTVASHRMLYESRVVWAALNDASPLAVRFGVGISLVNWLLFLGHADEVPAVFEALDRALADQPPTAMMPLLVAAHRVLMRLRAGEAVDWQSLAPHWDAAFGNIPMVGAMTQYALKGPIAFLNGNRVEARQAFALGVDLSEAANSETVAVIAITNAAFFAWLAGEGALLAMLVERLVRASAPNVAEATRHFVGCARGAEPSRTPTGYELPVYRAYGWFVAAARETNQEGRRRGLHAAVDAAAQDGQPWLNALAWAALGHADAGVRSDAFRRAREFGDRVHVPAFRAALDDVLNDRIPAAWAGFGAFVEFTASDPIAIGLLSRELRIGSRTIGLSTREAEMLLALALHDAPRDSATLAAMIWPDAPERNTSHVKVYITRLRRRLGGLDLIEAKGSGYRLKRAISVDLFTLEEAIRSRRMVESFDPELETIVSSRHVRLPQWIAASEWLAPYARRYERAIDTIREARAADAESRNDRESALHYRHLLVAEQHPD